MSTSYCSLKESIPKEINIQFVGYIKIYITFIRNVVFALKMYLYDKKAGRS
jgi:hypothetical protein